MRVRTASYICRQAGRPQGPIKSCIHVHIQHMLYMRKGIYTTSWSTCHACQDSVVNNDFRHHQHTLSLAPAARGRAMHALAYNAHDAWPWVTYGSNWWQSNSTYGLILSVQVASAYSCIRTSGIQSLCRPACHTANTTCSIQ